MAGALIQLDSFARSALEPSLIDVETVMRGRLSAQPEEFAHRAFAQHLDTGGKRLRARIALAAGRALGADAKALVQWAAAVEIMHNATLIHDDIQDKDRWRRGEPTTWARYGVAQAINVGDLGLMLPFAIVGDMDAPADQRANLSSLVARHGILAAQGQSMTLGFLQSEDLSRAAFRRCAEEVTGAFFRLPVEGAAILSGFTLADASRLGRCFLDLGVLFQIQDDIIDLYGVKGREEPGGDVRDGKVSALVVNHLERRPHDTRWLLPLLSQNRGLTTNEDVQTVANAFIRSGALDTCFADIDALAAAVRGDELLVSLPGLHRVATEFLDLVLKPLESLR